MPETLRDRVIVITGAARRMGRAYVEAFLEHGAQVVGLGMRVGALLRPEHVVPLVLHLASQDASADTGKAFDAVQWNVRHGFGGADRWQFQTGGT